jgi:competence protein ComEC
VSRGVLLAAGLALLVLGRGFVLGRQLLAPLPVRQDHVLVQACIESIPELADAGWSVDAQVRFPRHPEWAQRQLRLQLPAGLPAPGVGDCWQYAAHLSQPQGAGAAVALLRNHLSGYARIDDGPLNQRLTAGAIGLTALRAHLARRIADQVEDPAAAALLAALAVGATGDLTARQWQVFNATGITHLVAISGMHVTFFALLAMAAARRIWQRLAPRVWLPRRSAFASAVGCLLALLYALLAGFSVPAQRTAVMLTAFLGVRECARCAAPAWSVAAALAAVLLYDPMAPLGAGFWLSFAAVLAIVLLVGGRLQSPAPLRAALHLQWVVSITLMPVTVAMFGSFAAAGILVNLVAIPVFSLLLVPPVLIATACYLVPGVAAAWCAAALLKLAGWAAAALWPGLAWVADLPGALWHAAPPWGWYVLAMPAVLLALLPVTARVRIAALGVLGSVFLLRAPRPHQGELWIDTRGQGATTTVVLRTHEHLLLLGTGESFRGNGRRFARRVLPRLLATGYAQLDLWLPGTLTRDVQAALRIASAQIPVRAVILPPAHEAPPELGTCTAASWRWDGIDLRLRASSDGRTCVLSASVGGHSIEADGTAIAASAIPVADAADLVLDDSGLAMRQAPIGL